MKRSTLILAMFCLLGYIECYGQKPTDYFNTLGLARCCHKAELKEENTNDDNEEVLTSYSDTCGFGQDAVEQARIKEYYADSLSKSTDNESKELNFENLLTVLGEVGISNKLFVLAQAMLETGNFKSDVCRRKHNLFGLYNSKRREYYRFARWEDSVVAYKNMIQYRYKGGNYLHFLKRIGYAEDPRYIVKVAQMARNIYKQYFAK